MNIKKILGLNSQCPHCDVEIGIVTKLKGLLFCPACGESLLLKPVEHQNPNSIKKDLLLWFLASLGFATWHTTEYQGWEIGLYVEPILWLLLICCLCWLVFALVTGRLYRNGTAADNWLSGVDQIDVVQKDICPEYGTRRTNIPPSGVVAQCLHCQSQRVSDRYWYKRSMAQQVKAIHHEINDVDEDLFLGCLACGRAFEFQKRMFNREQRKVVWVQLIAFFVFLMFFMAALWMFSLGKQQVSWISQFLCFWLSGASWFTLLLLPQKNAKSNEKPFVLQPLKLLSVFEKNNARQFKGLLANVPRVLEPESAEEAEFLAAIAEDDQRTKTR